MGWPFKIPQVVGSIFSILLGAEHFQKLMAFDFAVEVKVWAKYKLREAPRGGGWQSKQPQNAGMKEGLFQL